MASEKYIDKYIKLTADNSLDLNPYDMIDHLLDEISDKDLMKLIGIYEKELRDMRKATK